MELEGQTKTITIEPRTTSQTTLNRLRQLLLKRRREMRIEMIKDFRQYGGDLPQAAQSGFAKELLQMGKEDTELGSTDTIRLVANSDPDALAVVLWSCSPDVRSLEEAKEVIGSVGSVMEIASLINEVMTEEFESLKNLIPQPETEPSDTLMTSRLG